MYDQERLDAENDASLNHAECANPTANENGTSSNHWESENETSGGTHANLSSRGNHWTPAWSDGTHGSPSTPTGYGHYEECRFSRSYGYDRTSAA